MWKVKLEPVRFATVVLAATLGLLATGSVQAVPSMARQTGYECSKCHTVFPELTRFGRQFKLGAFAMSSEKWDAAPFLERLPVSGLLQVSRTQTKNTDTDGAMSDSFPRDRETIVQAAGFYYAGKITDNAGALIQYNYNGIEKKWGMEMFDVRYANSKSVGDKELAYGVTLNNSPTVSDIYNSTPMWGFPHTDSAGIMPAASTLIDMMLASQVGGVGIYALWDESYYGEVAGYRKAKPGIFRFMAAGDKIETALDGYAPYWRFAWQKESGPSSFEIGTYGMIGKVLSDAENSSSGSDRFRDVGADASYQFVKGDHIVSAHATWINEKQDWNSSFPMGLRSNPSTDLNTMRMDFHYFFRRQWGGGVQVFRTSGDKDLVGYGTGEAVMGSANGSPNSRGWITEVNYLPVQNIKLAVRYTAYQQFNGASRNYDGFGRNAKDNNALYLLAWVLF